MIRIAFVIDTIETPTAGTEKQLLLLLRHLDRSSFDPILCVLYSSKWLDEHFNLCPIHVIDIRSFKKPKTFLALMRFIRFLKTEKVNVVHTFFRDGNIVGVTAGKLAKVGKIISSRRNQGYWMTPLDLKVTKLLNCWVDTIVANSMDTKNWTVRFEGFPEEKIQVIYNGIDLKSFQNIPPDNRSSMRKAFGIPDGVPVIGMVANLRPVKAHDILLKAAQKVIKCIPEAHFVLVGDGELKQKLVQMTNDLGIPENVHFLGRRTDIPNILNMLDVGVLSSSSESFSNALVEYIASGLPVVCTDVGGVREVIEDGVNGHVVPTGNHLLLAKKIIYLIQKGNTNKNLKYNKIKFLDLCVLNKVITTYQNLYQN